MFEVCSERKCQVPSQILRKCGALNLGVKSTYLLHFFHRIGRYLHVGITYFTYHKKNGSQHSMKVPIIIPKVRAALCSLFIFIIFLSFVGVH